MNDKGKRFWDNSINNIDEEYIEEMSETLYKKSLTDFNENDLVIVETEKKNKFPIFALVASIVAIIGVAVITGVIISNTGIFTAPLESDSDSSIVSESESDDSSIIENENSSETESIESSDVQDNINFTPVGDFKYQTNDDGSITIKEYTGTANEVVIPGEIEGKKVTGIGMDAFDSCTSLTSITIPYGVTEIGYAAFSGYPSLTAINVGVNNQSYCSVDGVLFSKDMSEIILYPRGKTDASYTIPDGVTSIDTETFENCVHLDSITVPASVTELILNRPYIGIAPP